MKVFLWTLGVAAAVAGVGGGVYYYLRRSPKAPTPLVDPGVPRLVKGPPPTPPMSPEAQAVAIGQGQGLFAALTGRSPLGQREKRTTPLTPEEIAAQQAVNNQPPPNGGSGFWGAIGDAVNVGVDVLPVVIAAV